jgi:hypothetical protein
MSVVAFRCIVAELFGGGAAAGVGISSDRTSLFDYIGKRFISCE